MSIDLAAVDLAATTLTGSVGGALRPGTEVELHARDATLRRVELDRCELPGSDLADCRIESSSLIGVVLDGARWRSVVVESCDLSGAVFSDSRLVEVTFRGCKLSNASFHGSALERVVIDDCAMLDARWQGGTVESVRVRNSDLRRTLFDRVRIDAPRGLDLRGSNLEDTRGLPSLSNLLVDPAQSAMISAALLAERSIETSETDVD